MREAFGRGGSTHNPARRRPGEAGAGARGGLGLAQLAEERLDVLDELLGPETVEEVTASWESLHGDVGELLQLPLGRIVHRPAKSGLAGEHERRRPDVRERAGERARGGIVARGARVDERRVDVAEVRHDTLRRVEAAELAVGPLAPWPGRGKWLLRHGLGECRDIARAERFTQLPVPRRVPRFRIRDRRVLENDGADEIGSVACGNERSKRAERVPDQHGWRLRDLTQDAERVVGERTKRVLGGAAALSGTAD